MTRAEGEAPIEPRLDDRVIEAFQGSSGRIAFGGLRRRLQVHPESLSRALHRLERDGLIRKNHGAYELVNPPESSSPSAFQVATRTLAVAELPPAASREEIFGRLAGRWFGSLRWVGLFDRPDDPWLVWSVGDGPQLVMLSVRQRKMRVLAEKGTVPPASATILAAFSLLGQAVNGRRDGAMNRPEGSLFLLTAPRAAFND
jgi:hypothetical protein